MASWIFGYGSLMWRPGFAALERREGRVHGWARRFYQGSPDHRGTPGYPGRVLTLVPQEGEACWGVTYRLASADMGAILEALDDREQAGYLRRDVQVHCSDEEVLDAVTYIAAPDNPNFLGSDTLESMVNQLATAVGPSGTNAEYVLSLHDFLRDRQIVEPHVDRLIHGLLSHLETN